MSTSSPPPRNETNSTGKNSSTPSESDLDPDLQALRAFYEKAIEKGGVTQEEEAEFWKTLTPGTVCHRVDDPIWGPYFWVTRDPKPVFVPRLKDDMHPPKYHPAKGIAVDWPTPGRVTTMVTVEENEQGLTINGPVEPWPTASDHIHAETLPKMDEETKERLRALLDTVTSHSKAWRLLYQARVERDEEEKAKIAEIEKDEPEYGSPEYWKNQSKPEFTPAEAKKVVDLLETIPGVVTKPESTPSSSPSIPGTTSPSTLMWRERSSYLTSRDWSVLETGLGNSSE
jgi:hypothetical protein